MDRVQPRYTRSDDFKHGYLFGYGDGQVGEYRPDFGPQPIDTLWEAFHAAMAVFGDESEQAATIFRIHREAEEATRQ